VAEVSIDWERQIVTPEEAKDVFFGEPLIVRSDVRHSRAEKRYLALGQTRAERFSAWCSPSGTNP
jgi:uncharacterized DUF497 family protein